MDASHSRKPNPKSFRQWTKSQNLQDWQTQLAQAFDHIVAIAADAGIDWARLQHQLPVPGTLLKSGQLPVLTSKDRGRSAFVWHLNPDRHGGPWACLVFLSFRHGGVHQIVHLRRWAWDRFNIERGLALSVPSTPRPRIDAGNERAERQEQARRAQRFALTQQRWVQASSAGADHPLLQRRLCGDANPALLARLGLRRSSDRLGEHLMIRLQHRQHGHTGFQQLHIRPLDERGRTQHLVMREAGLKNGSFTCIRATAGHEHWPVAICEGLFTALSVALAWPGPLAVTLDAYNLAHVRASIRRRCVFFADDDRAGGRNTGLRQAQAAAQAHDLIVLPCFPAGESPQSCSDFNDLHRIAGLEEVRRQVRAAWPQTEPQT